MVVVRDRGIGWLGRCSHLGIWTSGELPVGWLAESQPPHARRRQGLCMYQKRASTRRARHTHRCTFAGGEEHVLRQSVRWIMHGPLHLDWSSWSALHTPPPFYSQSSTGRCSRSLAVRRLTDALHPERLHHNNSNSSNSSSRSRGGWRRSGWRRSGWSRTLHTRMSPQRVPVAKAVATAAAAPATAAAVTMTMTMTMLLHPITQGPPTSCDVLIAGIEPPSSHHGSQRHPRATCRLSLRPCSVAGSPHLRSAGFRLTTRVTSASDTVQRVPAYLQPADAHNMMVPMQITSQRPRVIA